jgi:hypothetical protein
MAFLSRERVRKGARETEGWGYTQRHIDKSITVSPRKPEAYIQVHYIYIYAYIYMHIFSEAYCNVYVRWRG